jgi:hypothetical protein
MHFQDRGMKTEANDLYKDDNRGIVRWMKKQEQILIK